MTILAIRRTSNLADAKLSAVCTNMMERIDWNGSNLEVSTHAGDSSSPSQPGESNLVGLARGGFSSLVGVSAAAGETAAAAAAAAPAAGSATASGGVMWPCDSEKGTQIGASRAFSKLVLVLCWDGDAGGE